MKRTVVLALSITFAVSCVQPPAVDPAYRKTIDAWKAHRLMRLTAPDGWTTLAGLWWLKDGVNTVGADAGNDVVLPKGAGVANVGAIVVDGTRARLEASPASGLASGELTTDEKADPTVEHLGTVSFFIKFREGKLAVRVRDTESEARKHFVGLDYFPLDPVWRFEARFEPYNPPKTIAVPSVVGTPEHDVCPGAIAFDHGGTTYRVDAVLEEGSDELFIIFGDRTNGNSTYGGGRFVYAPFAKNGTTVLDFNKAYSPPCIFTPYATCPLPPPQNRLPFEVTAGEKKYRGARH